MLLMANQLSCCVCLKTESTVIWRFRLSVSKRIQDVLIWLACRKTKYPHPHPSPISAPLIFVKVVEKRQNMSDDGLTLSVLKPSSCQYLKMDFFGNGNISRCESWLAVCEFQETVPPGVTLSSIQEKVNVTSKTWYRYCLTATFLWEQTSNVSWEQLLMVIRSINHGRTKYCTVCNFVQK